MRGKMSRQYATWVPVGMRAVMDTEWLLHQPSIPQTLQEVQVPDKAQDSHPRLVSNNKGLLASLELADYSTHLYIFTFDEF